jgi:hypothetical protein
LFAHGPQGRHRGCKGGFADGDRVHSGRGGPGRVAPGPARAPGALLNEAPTLLPPNFQLAHTRPGAPTLIAEAQSHAQSPCEILQLQPSGRMQSCPDRRSATPAVREDFVLYAPVDKHAAVSHCQAFLTSLYTLPLPSYLEPLVLVPNRPTCACQWSCALILAPVCAHACLPGRTPPVLCACRLVR